MKLEESEGFLLLLSQPEGVHRVGRQLTRPPLNALLKAPDTRFWVKQYPATFDRGESPLFLALATLDPGTVHQGVFGTRAVEATLGQVFTGIFAAARAVLTASDLDRKDRERRDLYSAATHDLRGPISSLRQFAEGLEGLTGRNAELRTELLRKADDAILRIENVLYEWLSRPEPHVFSPIEARPFIADIVSQVVANAAPSVILKNLESLPHDGVFLGHEVSLMLALKNVLDNAIKFGRDTPVHVNVSVTPAPEADASAPLKATIEVRDHGIGIPAEERKIVFKAGHRTQQSRRHVVRGVGIGLSLTKAIVEKHGGQIWVDPSVSVGTSMVIQLPLHRRT